jgi:outer membrane lipoprotein LolB
VSTRRWLLATLSFAIVFIAACAHPTRTSGTFDPKVAFWSGRLSLQVDQAPEQSFAAAFELKGSATSGELLLLSPFGSTLAVLRWQPGSATLTSGGDVRRFDSLEALVGQATGTPIPVSALFEWLAGVATPVPGWQADLSQLSDSGRLNARRISPTPTADLRVALDR